ncbi:MAG TPA: hypothetical protein VF972_09605 [Actinomycetota bacterium]
MNPWADASSWEGDGLRRHVFFFNSGTERLYGSLYAAIDARTDVRLVICTGWGHDMLQLNDLDHHLALGIARLGGAAVLFHPPGHGDSTGSIADLTVQQHVAAALDAGEVAAKVVGSDGWSFCGVRIGAAVAALASLDGGGRLLPMIEPVLDLPRHFEALRRRARRVSLGRGDDDILFGHPLPTRAETTPPGRDPAEGVSRFPGPAAAIRFSDSPAEVLPEGLDVVEVPGRFSNPPGPREQATMASAAVRWIAEAAMAGVAQ